MIRFGRDVVIIHLCCDAETTDPVFPGGLLGEESPGGIGGFPSARESDEEVVCFAFSLVKNEFLALIHYHDRHSG